MHHTISPVKPELYAAAHKSPRLSAMGGNAAFLNVHGKIKGQLPNIHSTGRSSMTVGSYKGSTRTLFNAGSGHPSTLQNQQHPTAFLTSI
jgi:hypothetical protein